MNDRGVGENAKVILSAEVETESLNDIDNQFLALWEGVSRGAETAQDRLIGSMSRSMDTMQSALNRLLSTHGQDMTNWGDTTTRGFERMTKQVDAMSDALGRFKPQSTFEKQWFEGITKELDTIREKLDIGKGFPKEELEGRFKDVQSLLQSLQRHVVELDTSSGRYMRNMADEWRQGEQAGKAFIEVFKDRLPEEQLKKLHELLAIVGDHEGFIKKNAEEIRDVWAGIAYEMATGAQHLASADKLSALEAGFVKEPVGRMTEAEETAGRVGEVGISPAVGGVSEVSKADKLSALEAGFVKEAVGRVTEAEETAGRVGEVGISPTQKRWNESFRELIAIQKQLPTAAESGTGEVFVLASRVQEIMQDVAKLGDMSKTVPDDLKRGLESARDRMVALVDEFKKAGVLSNEVADSMGRLTGGLDDASKKLPGMVSGSKDMSSVWKDVGGAMGAVPGLEGAGGLIGKLAGIGAGAGSILTVVDMLGDVIKEIDKYIAEGREAQRQLVAPGSANVLGPTFAKETMRDLNVRVRTAGGVPISDEQFGQLLGGEVGSPFGAAVKVGGGKTLNELTREMTGAQLRRETALEEQEVARKGVAGAEETGPRYGLFDRRAWVAPEGESPRDAYAAKVKELGTESAAAAKDYATARDAVVTAMRDMETLAQRSNMSVGELGNTISRLSRLSPELEGDATKLQRQFILLRDDSDKAGVGISEWFGIIEQAQTKFRRLGMDVDQTSYLMSQYGTQIRNGTLDVENFTNALTEMQTSPEEKTVGLKAMMMATNVDEIAKTSPELAKAIHKAINLGPIELQGLSRILSVSPEDMPDYMKSLTSTQQKEITQRYGDVTKLAEDVRKEVGIGTLNPVEFGMRGMGGGRGLVAGQVEEEAIAGGQFANIRGKTERERQELFHDFYDALHHTKELTGKTESSTDALNKLALNLGLTFAGVPGVGVTPLTAKQLRELQAEAELQALKQPIPQGPSDIIATTVGELKVGVIQRVTGVTQLELSGDHTVINVTGGAAPTTGQKKPGPGGD